MYKEKRIHAAEGRFGGYQPKLSRRDEKEAPCLKRPAAPTAHGGAFPDPLGCYLI